MPGARQVALSSLHVTAVNYAVYFVNIFAQAIIARFLVPEDYGTFALALSTIEILFVAFALDFPTAALQMGGKDRVYENATALCLINMAALLVLGSAAVFALRHRFDTTVVLIFSVVFFFRLFNILSKVFLTFLEKDFRFLRSGLLRAAVRLLALGTGIWMAVRGAGVYSLVAIEVINCVALLALSLVYSPLRFRFSGVDRSIMAATLAQTLRLLNYRISNILFYRLPNLLIGVLTRDKVVVGILDRSLYWANLPTTVTSAFHSQILFVVFARNRDRKGVLADSLNWALWLMARVAICFSIVLWFYPEAFVSLVLGGNWSSIVPVLKALSVYSFFVLLYNIMIQAFVGLKRESALTRWQYGANLVLVSTIAAIVRYDLPWSWLAAAFSATTTLLFFCLAWSARGSELKVRFWFIFRTPAALAAFSCLALQLPGVAGLPSGAALVGGAFIVLVALLDRRDMAEMIRLLRGG